jgi:uncharacterized protein (TIGR02597 family)
MKTKITYSLLAAAAACSLVNAQTTAYTTPVGYVSINVPNETDSKIAIPLLTPSAWSGVASGISTNTITVSAGSFVDSAYVDTHMLQVTTGNLAGRIFPITANGTGNLTVDSTGSNSLADQGFSTGTSFVIRPYWTLDSLFPQGAGVGQSSDPFSPTTSLFFADNSSTGINRGLTDNFFYYDGSQGGDAGWYDVNNLEAGPQGSLIIPPDKCLTVRNLSVDPLSIVVTGEVPSVAVATLVVSDTIENDSLAQVAYPIDTSLAQSELFETGAVSDSSDPFSPTDMVFVYDPATTGLNPAASAAYFHYDGSQGGDAGWYDLNNLEAGLIDNDLIIKSGSQIFIRKAAGSELKATTWKAPLPYILNQ